jgi:SAM-dependent methyltransferase
MNADATIPFGLALNAYFEGESDVEFIPRRDDGVESSVLVKHFFQSESEFNSIERTAIEQCHGHVLDIGAGIGLHSLALEARGLTVTAIDINPKAADIMRRRGVRNSRQADVCKYRGGPFDTLYMIGHENGIIEDLKGLGKFLAHAKELVQPEGQLILDSLDVSRSKVSTDIAYHEMNRRAGRYIGEIVMQFEFRDSRGPFCPWLHINLGTLEEYAGEAGWSFETLLEIENGEYLTRLQKIRAV